MYPSAAGRASGGRTSPHMAALPAVASSRVWRVFYDDQCEICQAGVTWLELLDRDGRIACLPLDPEQLSSVTPPLHLEDCLRELHAVAPDGTVWRGADAVAALARQFPWTWPLGALAMVPGPREAARIAYRLVAQNRYALSKCRGGRCRFVRVGEVRRRSTWAAFWSCYLTGLLLRLPLMGASAVRELGHRLAAFARTFRRRFVLLEGKLTLYFLGGFPCDLVPIGFGEAFVMIGYDGIVVDPGSPRMRGSVRRHLRGRPPVAVDGIVATHHHEEHVGNLEWLAGRTGAPVHAGAATTRLLRTPSRLPWARRIMIGQPPALTGPVVPLEGELRTRSATLQVIPTPGHCDDHMALFDPREKVLLAGDCFMGTYFATPNPDVDSRAWVETLDLLLALDIEVLVEGHGHVHTLRKDVPSIPGVVIREDPKGAIRRKRDMMVWVRDQIDTGRREGLPVRAVEATCFPWNQKRSWEGFLNDEMIRLFSSGHFSRSEMVRSFSRRADGASAFPMVYELRFYDRREPD
jgi:glyoxylase-like metal-dependent hydrolase (beta-lactamase superfamily II)/predicted DCC family thiol-disulfide oxidoreductase YuxK